jgi:hypothetical protein
MTPLSHSRHRSRTHPLFFPPSHYRIPSALLFDTQGLPGLPIERTLNPVTSAAPRVCERANDWLGIKKVAPQEPNDTTVVLPASSLLWAWLSSFFFWSAKVASSCRDVIDLCVVQDAQQVVVMGHD